MQKYGVWIIALAGLIITGCASVKPVEFKKFGNTSKYKYAVVGKTQALRSQYGSSTKDSDGDVHYSSQSNSINPNDVITGILMQKGFIVLDSLKNNPDHKPQTLFVQYGQGRVYTRGFFLFPTRIVEVVMQIMDFETSELLFACNAEGSFGGLETDGLRHGIIRCLDNF